jgi:hypothetical protein
MEPWGTAIFLVLLALAVVALGAIVSRMVKSIDPNDAAGLVNYTGTGPVTVKSTEIDEKNEKAWAWRLSALEARVQFHYENFIDANRNATRLIRSLLTRVDHLENEMDTIARTSGNMDVENGADVAILSKRIDDVANAIASLAEQINAELLALRGLCALSADKSRTALQTANEALVVANTTETDMRRVIDSATLRAALEVYRHAEFNDSTPEDESGEYTDVDGRVLCKHGNPVQFHYEGGCDT